MYLHLVDYQTKQDILNLNRDKQDNENKMDLVLLFVHTHSTYSVTVQNKP